MVAAPPKVLGSGSKHAAESECLGSSGAQSKYALQFRHLSNPYIFVEVLAESTPSEALEAPVSEHHSPIDHPSSPKIHPALPRQTYDLESLATALETNEAALDDSDGPRDGIYHICNIKHGNKVALSQNADREDLVGFHATSNLEGLKWIVKRYNNTSKYSITNVDYNWNAACDHMPIKDGNIFTSQRLYQWMLLPTGNEENSFLIGTFDEALYWGLEDSEDGTPITLRTAAFDERNIWQFVQTK
ncbi:hypothetical protein FRC12_005142 [Ceratobasidium sp. 428]|nr:hypothetical protein FRC12_005142 [Ceratobasidium sp. 428]